MGFCKGGPVRWFGTKRSARAGYDPFKRPLKRFKGLLFVVLWGLPIPGELRISADLTGVPC